MKRLALFVLAFALANGSAAEAGAASSHSKPFCSRKRKAPNGLAGRPASPREFETFFSELIGPAEAAQFWQAAFHSLLENVRLAHGQSKAGYIRALNLTVPSNELNRRNP
jgi:hypothetical protein